MELAYGSVDQIHIDFVNIKGRDYVVIDKPHEVCTADVTEELKTNDADKIVTKVNYDHKCVPK